MHFVPAFCMHFSGMSLLHSLLERKLKVVLSDSREVLGTLHCVDSYGNLILHDVEVQYQGLRPQILSSAMVPGQHIQQVFCLAQDEGGLS